MYRTIHFYLRIYNGGSGIRGTLTDLFPAKMESRYSAHDKSSMCCDDVYVKKAKSFRNSCAESYDCGSLLKPACFEDYTVNDEMLILIQKLITENLWNRTKIFLKQNII